MRAFFFSCLLATYYATLTTFHFFILVRAEGTTSIPFSSYMNIYQFLPLGQKHTSGTEGTRILRIPRPKEILENRELNRRVVITMMV